MEILKRITGDEAALLVKERKTAMPITKCNVDRDLARDMGLEKSSRLPVYDSWEIEHPAHGRVVVYTPVDEPHDHGYVRRV